MHINAFVLVAQLANFLLLMFLLKRLLYDRIAAAMDARTAEIAAPSSEDSKTLRRALPMVWPKPLWNGAATNFP